MSGRDDADVRTVDERIVQNFEETYRLADDEDRAYLRGVVDAMRRKCLSSLKTK